LLAVAVYLRARRRTAEVSSVATQDDEK